MPNLGDPPNEYDPPYRLAAQAAWAADLRERHGGIMRIGRAIIIPAILALGVAGSALSGSAIAVAAIHAPAAHVQAVSAAPQTFYHN